MWERYRDGFGLPITIVSIIVILFDQGYARSSVLALIVGVQIFRMARDGWFLSSREKEYYEEQRRIEQIELERIREWEEGMRKETLDRLSSEFPVRPTKQRRRAIPRHVQDRVWRRDNGKCAGCGSNKNLEFDHIIPFSKGGANTYRNLQLLCQKCNRSKSDKIGG